MAKLRIEKTDHWRFGRNSKNYLTWLVKKNKIIKYILYEKRSASPCLQKYDKYDFYTDTI